MSTFKLKATDKDGHRMTGDLKIGEKDGKNFF